jgi:hypothetical protein
VTNLQSIMDEDNELQENKDPKEDETGHESMYLVDRLEGSSASNLEALAITTIQTQQPTKREQKSPTEEVWQIT